MLNNKLLISASSFCGKFQIADHNLNNLQIMWLISGDFNKHVHFLSQTVVTDWMEPVGSVNCAQVIWDPTHSIRFY